MSTTRVKAHATCPKLQCTHRGDEQLDGPRVGGGLDACPGGIGKARGDGSGPKAGWVDAVHLGNDGAWRDDCGARISWVQAAFIARILVAVIHTATIERAAGQLFHFEFEPCAARAEGGGEPLGSPARVAWRLVPNGFCKRPSARQLQRRRRSTHRSRRRHRCNRTGHLGRRTCHQSRFGRRGRRRSRSRRCSQGPWTSTHSTQHLLACPTCTTGRWGSRCMSCRTQQGRWHPGS